MAYILSRQEISASPTTSGLSAVDIIANIDGSLSISIQVKGPAFLVGKRVRTARDVEIKRGSDTHKSKTRLTAGYQ
ncbi:hypothetical protein AAFN90_11995 [Erwiniaceae bacterium CAU 1747]